MNGPPAKNWTWIEHETLDKLMRVTPAARGVFLGLLRHANKERICWPSGRVLAELLHMDRRTIFRAFSELEKAKLIRREKGKKRSNIYALLSPLGDDGKTTDNTLSQLGDDGKTTDIGAQEQQVIGAQEQQEVNTDEVDANEESKLINYLLKEGERFRAVASRIMKITNPKRDERQPILKVAALMVTGEISESDFLSAVNFDPAKTKTTPTRHFLGILRRCLRAEGKNLDALMAGMKLPVQFK